MKRNSVNNGNDTAIYPPYPFTINRSAGIALGIFMILLGTLALYFTVFTTVISVALCGIILISAALVQFLHAFYQKRWNGFTLDMVMAVITLIPGILFLTKPQAGAAALTLLIAVMLMMKGLSRIFVAFAVQFHYWQLAIISGVISFFLGAYIMYQWPLDSLWLIGLFIAIDLIVNGWAFVFLGLSSKNETIVLPPSA